MEFALDGLVTLVSLAIVFVHAWALRGHFASDKMTAGALAVTGAVALTTLVYLGLQWSVQQPLLAQIVGTVLEVLGLVLFWRAVVALARGAAAIRVRSGGTGQPCHGWPLQAHPPPVLYLISAVLGGMGDRHLVGLGGHPLCGAGRDLYARRARRGAALRRLATSVLNTPAIAHAPGLFWPRLG